MLIADAVGFRPRAGEFRRDDELVTRDGPKAAMCLPISRCLTRMAVKLSQFKGKKPCVVFFYPNDNSPGCTKEVCAFEKAAPSLKKKGDPLVQA